jgi:hypothetical protein
MRGGVRREEVSKFFPVSSGQEQAESAAAASPIRQPAVPALAAAWSCGRVAGTQLKQDRNASACAVASVIFAGDLACIKQISRYTVGQSHADASVNQRAIPATVWAMHQEGVACTGGEF